MSKVLRDLEFLLLVFIHTCPPLVVGGGGGVEEDTMLSTFHMLYDNRMLELTSTGVEYADGWLAPYNHSIVQPNVGGFATGSVNLLMN